MRRLTAILFVLPVALALLAPTAMFAATKACCEHRAAGHDCPHPQPNDPPSQSSPNDCHRCCVGVVAVVAVPAPILAISLAEREFLAVAPPTLAPAAPVVAVIFERGPPASSCS